MRSLCIMVLCMMTIKAYSASQELRPGWDVGLFIGWKYDGIIPYPGNETPLEWNFNITPTVPTSQFLHMQWNLLNMRSKKLLFSEWRQLPQDQPKGLKLIIAQDLSLYELLPQQEDYHIVISENRDKIDYFISLKNMCVEFPNQFMDLTNPSNKEGCHVNRSKLPDVAKECTEHRQTMQDWINQGVITCEEVKKEFEKTRLCGIFECQ